MYVCIAKPVYHYIIHIAHLYMMVNKISFDYKIIIIRHINNSACLITVCNTRALVCVQDPVMSMMRGVIRHEVFQSI
jgi:hypothetical protein